MENNLNLKVKTTYSCDPLRRDLLSSSITRPGTTPSGDAGAETSYANTIKIIELQAVFCLWYVHEVTVKTYKEGLPAWGLF